jgi:ribosome-binding factor A
MKRLDKKKLGQNWGTTHAMKLRFEFDRKAENEDRMEDWNQ